MWLHERRKGRESGQGERGSERWSWFSNNKGSAVGANGRWKRETFEKSPEKLTQTGGTNNNEHWQVCLTFCAHPGQRGWSVKVNTGVWRIGRGQTVSLILVSLPTVHPRCSGHRCYQVEPSDNPPRRCSCKYCKRSSGWRSWPFLCLCNFSLSSCLILKRFEKLLEITGFCLQGKRL